MDKQIYAGEWKIMEFLWESSPRTVMEIVRAMGLRTGWAKSTVTTMVARMEAKGLLRYEADGGRAKKVYPTVTREQAAGQETDSLLEKVYHGSAGLLMTALVERNRLSQEELDQLYELLRRAEEESHG